MNWGIVDELIQLNRRLLEIDKTLARIDITLGVLVASFWAFIIIFGVAVYYLYQKKYMS